MYEYVFLFAIFGGTAIHMEILQSLRIADEMAKSGTEIGLFATISHLPFSTFFVTSVDSATFVVSMQTSNGNLSTKNSLKLILELTIAAITAFPFSIVVILMIISLFKELR